jgi:hypothetical protein
LAEPTRPVGPVHWGSYRGDLLERVMSVLLFQERPTAWHRRPSQGDGGLDVGEPKADGYHVYQIKGFTGSMGSSQRRQVGDSLQRILDDPRLDRPVTGWSLVVPVDRPPRMRDGLRSSPHRRRSLVIGRVSCSGTPRPASTLMSSTITWVTARLG